MRHGTASGASRRGRWAALLAGALAALALAAASAPGPAAGAEFAGLKARLDRQTALLVGFTGQFSKRAEAYYALAKGAGFDYRRMYARNRGRVNTLLRGTQRLWVAGNPLYERMEGIVAGVPSLSRFDVIIDAGGSGADDPASAVPFDLRLPDGRVFRQPGNFYNITEAALWGTEAAFRAPGAVRVDLDGNGRVDFGDTLPDAAFLLAAARDFDTAARDLRAAAAAYQPRDADAFTALVVMVPTMSEYFGQWKASRFIAGNRATSDSFNVVSRLSDINDILGSLQVVYRDVRPLIAADSAARAAQTGRSLNRLAAFVKDLYRREASGRRFTAEQAELLGGEAQARATAIAGQISQSAARLGIRIAG